jgi:hypothetical protein
MRLVLREDAMLQARTELRHPGWRERMRQGE